MHPGRDRSCGHPPCRGKRCCSTCGKPTHSVTRAAEPKSTRRVPVRPSQSYRHPRIANCWNRSRIGPCAERNDSRCLHFAFAPSKQLLGANAKTETRVTVRSIALRWLLRRVEEQDQEKCCNDCSPQWHHENRFEVTRKQLPQPAANEVAGNRTQAKD